ncbi:MAG: exosortase-associated EpsI family protein, partial [Phycisphaerae bacterium]
MPTHARGSSHYWLAVFLLAVGAAAMQVAKDYKILTVIKKPLPLRKPLNDLDRSALAPFRFEASRTMSPDIVQELGTDQYIYWTLLDPAKRRAKDRPVSVFVTYYTDIQDQVPHVPEECYHQGAFTPGDDDTLTMRLDSLQRDVKIR